MFDEVKGEFVYPKDQVLCLEHSLLSISKWESKWHKPFITNKDKKTEEEYMDYIVCMTLNQNVDPSVYQRLTSLDLKKIQDYMNDPMTATWFSKQKSSRGNGEQTTSELIYYWMVSYNIPFECQKWHLNRLLTLIQICNVKNAPQKKMGARELASQRSALNAARRKQHHTAG